MKSKSRKPQPVYTTAFKLEVISQVLDGTYTKEEAAKVYGIGGKSTILEWMRKLTIAQQEFITEKQQQQLAEDEVAQLRLQLKTERLRSDLYKKIIELAEQQFDIRIEKKYGAGQFKVYKNKKASK